MLNHDLKKEFQVERIAFFSDAVFAIAVTLLIIEIKVPELHGHVDSQDMLRALATLIPKFIGFIVSFFVIALYWVNHHLMFKFVEHYSPKLIWNNLLLLFSIILMPFSSAFYSDYWLYYNNIPMAFYAGNICMTGLLHFRLWNIVSNPANKLSMGLENPHLVRYYRTRALVTPTVFFICFLVSLVNVQLAYWMPSLIFLFMISIVRYYKKKHPDIFIKHTIKHGSKV